MEEKIFLADNNLLRKIRYFLNIIKKLAGKREVYLVGGFLRDYLLGKFSFDIDFIVFGEDDATFILAERFAKELDGVFIVLDEETKSYRVVKNKISFDFSKNRAKTLEADLACRDFSVNALSVKLEEDLDLSNLKIIDLNNSQEDLQNKVLRVLSEDVFKDDPLRLLRAFRIAANYNLLIDDYSFALIKRDFTLIHQSKEERVREEIWKFFAAENVFPYLLKMDESKLLAEIFTGIKFMQSHNDNYFHKLGLWGHCLEVFFCLEYVLENLDFLFDEEELILLEDYLAAGNRKKVKLASLFHDLGKPDTFSEKNGKIHFIMHDLVGSKQVSKMFEDMKFSNKEIKFISEVALFHMQAGNLAKEEEITQKACFRFFKRTGDSALGLLIFTLSDWLASIRGVKKIDYTMGISREEFDYEDFQKGLKSVKILLVWYLEKINEKTVKLLLNGNDIMQAFPDIKPSPFLGEILLALEEAQMIAQIKSKEEALIFVEKFIENKKV